MSRFRLSSSPRVTGTPLSLDTHRSFEPLLLLAALCMAFAVPAPAPAQPACTSGGDTLLCLEVRNALTTARNDEVAFSSVAIPRSTNLLGTESLYVESLEGQTVPAQFRPIARWNGIVSDPTRPIRWLEVAIQDPRPAQSTGRYRLRRAAGPAPAVPDPLTVTQQGDDFVVDTNTATVTIDSTNPALIDRVQVGAQTVYQHVAGAGPRLDLDGVVLDTGGAGEVVLDPGTFELIEQGPLKASFAVQGHFVDAGGTTLCGDFAPTVSAYQAMGFTAVVTLARNTSDLDLQVNFRNECLDAQFGPFTAGTRTVRQMSWELPTSVATTSRYLGVSGAIQSAAADVEVEQRKGGGTPWLRRARTFVGATEAAAGEAAERPIVAVGDASMVVAGQLSWMRFREPQSIATEGATLSLRFVSEPLVVGGGKGLWNTARVSFASGIDQASQLESVRSRNLAALERGLLVTAQLDDLNRASVFPSLGTGAGSLFETEYEAFMSLFHNGTVGPGGQHAQARTYGSQLWPDTVGQSWLPTAVGPTDNPGGLNYWSASRNELLEFYRTGDPRWVWELSLPLTWQQIMSAYVNLGENPGFKNGLNLTSAVCTGPGDLCEEGLWYRYGGGSDDYGYTWGNLGYVVRPTHALQRRFAAVGATVVARYSVPRAQQADRLPFVSEVDLQRQVIQHFVQLANCAEFVPGAEGQACHDRLIEVVTELSEENMSTGLMCQADIQPADPSQCFSGQGNPAADWCDCVQPQQFIQNSLIHPFFWRVLHNYGDLGGNLSSALSLSTWNLYRAGIGLDPAQAPALPSDPQRPAIDYVTADWLSQPGWDQSSLPYVIQDVDVTDDDPATSDPNPGEGNLILDPNYPQTDAMFLIAHQLDPALDLCDVARAPLTDQYMLDAWDQYENFGGWGKGPSQILQSVVFGLGAYDSCAQGPGNGAPTVQITAPTTGSSFPSGTEITLIATADDTEDGDLSAQVVWSSSLEGALGSGASIDIELGDGTHTITATVTDSGSSSAFDAIAVTLGTDGGGGQCPGQFAYQEGFESGAAGWSTSGLWHRVTGSTCATPSAAAGASAMYYGQDTSCDFETGAANSGDLISPTVRGVQADAELSFSFLRQVEQAAELTVDRTEVFVRQVGAPTWTSVWTRDSQTPSANSWQTAEAISLASWQGEDIEVRFQFDSDDEQFNQFVGWMVDDVRISGCATALFADGFESGDLSAWSSTIP